jgi:phage-related tail protein
MRKKLVTVEEQFVEDIDMTTDNPAEDFTRRKLFEDAGQVDRKTVEELKKKEEFKKLKKKFESVTEEEEEESCPTLRKMLETGGLVKKKSEKDHVMQTPRRKDADKRTSVRHLPERSLGKMMKSKGFKNENVKKIRNLFETSSPKQVIERLLQPNLQVLKLTNFNLSDPRLNPEIRPDGQAEPLVHLKRL